MLGNVGGAKFETVEAVRDFILAGDATVTLVSAATGTRFTYAVRTPRENNAPVSIHFVSLLNGPDNRNDFQFLGTIFEGKNFRHGAKSRISRDATSAKAFAWAARNILELGRMPPNCEIWHEGKCGRCGRALTVPESIATGLGPICAQRAA